MRNKYRKLESKSVYKTGILVCLMIGALIASSIHYSHGQATITPVRYYTFNTSTAGADSTGASTMNITAYGGTYSQTNGMVGKCLSLGTGGSLIDCGTLSLDTGLTVEFLFKPSMEPGSNFNTSSILQRADQYVDIKMYYPEIYFKTYHKSGSGSYVYDELIVTLNGIGRKSYGYYMDGNWHHMVFRFSGSSGKKEIWVDGELPAGFSKTVTTGGFDNPSGNNKTLWINHTVSYRKYFGSLDEIAIYNRAIPAALIYKHYIEALQGKPYSYSNNYTQSLPTPSPVSGSLDVNEFPVGYPGTLTTSAVDQLKTFPVPRYKPGHTIHPNFQWMDPLYFSGMLQPGVSNAQSVTNSVDIQTELAKNFNYMLQVSWNNDNWNTAWKNLANANPQWKVSLVTLRALMNTKVWSQTLANANYLQNSSGQFIDVNGNVTSSKIWRPTAPISDYTSDGTTVRNAVSNGLQGLNRTINVLNENGEIFPFINNAALAADPVVTADKNSSGLDWENYLAKRIAQNETQAYRDIIMTLPQLQGTAFTEYRFDGHRTWQFRWEQTRNIMTPINGNIYSTCDFYPRYPNNWREWSGPWHGLKWVIESRYHEIAAGDKLFSPFISPGWDATLENNVLPAQWLGLLKCLGMYGAEFYYTGYFNDAPSYMPPNPPPNDPKGYAWQAVMPSYAQGVTSRFEDVLKNGSLLPGDMMNDYSQPTSPGYQFSAGDLRKVVVVRKKDNVEKYAITGTIQPNSNEVGNAELEGDAKISVNGQTLQFKIRRQGSTYIYDKSDAANPLFYQLDAWHEYSHPSRWSKDFNIEAELYDNTNATYNLKTYVPAGTVSGDYRNATTCITFPNSQTTFTPIEYVFIPREASMANQYVWVRARSRSGQTTGMSIAVDNSAAKTIGCVSDTNWAWYRMDACSQQAISFTGLTIASHTLKITPASNQLEIDKIVLTSNASLAFTPQGNACSSGSTPSVTANGSLTFCQGGNVTLTASAGSSYLWSNGATTQSITVNASGNYVVTVSNSGGGCSGVSAPQTVTVNPLPVASISPNNTVTICSGNAVTLTASGGSSYVWNPGGQTTASISVSSAGNYAVVAYSSAGCSASSPAVTVNVTANPSATITANGPVTFCQGNSVVLTSSSGSSYVWSNGATTQSITVNTTGNYIVTVTNTPGNCSATSAPKIVTVNALPTVSVTPNSASTICSGTSLTLTANGGNSYVWSPGGQTTSSISVSASGNYSVSGYNSQGCSAVSVTVPVTVVQTPTATISANGPTTFCQGGSVILTASGSGSYLWSPGNQTTASITVTASGSYTVKVTGSGGCSATSSPVNVSVNPLPAATITAGGPLSFCQGGSVTLTATTGATYLWTPGGQTTQSVTANSSGSYSVTVFNQQGCSAVSSIQNVTVFTPVVPLITPSGSTTLSQGQSITLTSTASSAYNWTPGGQTSQSILVSAAGSYRVTTTDGNGCQATSAAVIVTVVNNNPVQISASGPLSFCQGDSVQLTASAGFTYLWTPGLQTSQSIWVKESGTYMVQASNGTSAQVSVTAMPKPMQPVITISYIPNVAYQLTAYEPSAISYLWSNGQTTQTITVATVQTVTVTASNAFGCQSNGQTMSVPGPAAQPCGKANMLTAFNIIDVAATLGWNPAVTADSFYVSYTQQGTSNTITKKVAGNASSVRIDGLIPGATYNWNVRTFCVSGNQTSSQAVFSTLSGPLSCGSTPNNLYVSNLSDKSAKLNWYITTAQKFTIRYRILNTPSYSYKTVNASSNPDFAFLFNLQANTTYEWSVNSLCNGVTSAFAPANYFTTYTPCPMPTIVSIQEITHNQALVRWDPTVASDTIKIRYAKAGTFGYQWRTVVNSGSNGRQFLSKLDADTYYYVQLRSKCSSGSNSAWTDTVMFKTQPLPVVRVTTEENPLQLNAYPNPATDKITLAFMSETDSKYTVKVADMSGRELLRQQHHAYEGENAQELNLSGFTSGIYMLIVEQGPVSGRFKFSIH